MMLAGLLVVAIIGLGAVLTSTALAASAEIAILADNPPPPPKPTGAASTYTINFTCSAVSGSSCGADPTITIPLELTSVNPATPAITSWAYSVSSAIPGLVLSGAVIGGDYVITLNESKLNPGDSDTVSLSVTPPNDITPNGATWSLTPSFTTESIAEVTAPAPALGAASASPQLSVSKVTSDGGAVYVVGNNVVYNIVAQCNSGNPAGSLYITSGGLADTLPAGLKFVSATPTPSSAPAPGSTGTITWEYPTAASLPSGCSASGMGTRNYQVTAAIDPATPNNAKLENSVTLSGTPIGSATVLNATAIRPITVVSEPPANPGSFLTKSAQGPLSIPSLGFDATYAGHWITPINARPASSPGAAEGEYSVSIKYPASRGYETDLADPVPCLENLSMLTVYSSNTPSGAIDGPASINNLCQQPAFDPTVVQVSSASLAAAITGDGWTPTGIKPDGSTFALTLNGTAGTSAYFEVPSIDLGHVAAIELGRDANLTDVGMSMNVWGYGDVSLLGGDALHNIATATAYPLDEVTPTTHSQAATLYIEPSAPQLGMFKSFGTLGAAPGATTALTLTGNLSTPAPPSGNVVMSDLLPYGLSWHNPKATANFTLTAGRGGTGTPVAATLLAVPNFEGTGRELIRITFAKSAFTSGYYTLTPPTNLIELTVPAGTTTYNNTAQLFVAGVGQETSPTCGPGTTSTPSTFQSTDPLDLSGDGLATENYCEWAASLSVPPSGGPNFTLVKSVQGNLDSVPKFSPGIGLASVAGSGVYTLKWSNTGGKNLTDPIVYDILPYVGDTGVSQGQAGTPRGSQFATAFTGISGSLPSGVTVQYSTSTNPCRPEVYPDVANPGCVNDWSPSAPAELSQVKALQFAAATQTYTPGQSFTVMLGVAVPAGFVNTVAWNSAASDADYNAVALLPAEPPKVGLTAPAPLLTPTLSTSASTAEALPLSEVADTVTVANTGGGAGTLAWSLLGPLAAAANGSCSGLSWVGAAAFASGTIAVSGDGPYATPTSAPSGAGCYSYEETLTGGGFAGPATSAAGSSGETVLIHTATLSTGASAALIQPEGTVTDAIQLGGTSSGAGAIEWQLLGPLAPAPDGSCTGLDWTGAATFGSGMLVTAGDGSYPTPASSPTESGCYGYAELLTTGSAGGPASSLAGTAGETVLVSDPSLSSSVSSASVLSGGSVSDLVTVQGVGTSPGTLEWQLLGPVAPAASGGCGALDWSSAATLAQGTIPVGNDGTYPTPESSVPAAGCYGYVLTLSGAAYGAPIIGPAGSAGEVLQASNPSASPASGPSPGAIVNLSVVKRVNQASVSLGKPLTYTLTVSNEGPGTASTVNVTDTPQTAMTFVSASADQGSCAASFPVSCALGTIAPGAHTTVTVVAKPIAAGMIINGAHVTSPETNSAPAAGALSDATSHVRLPLIITKTASPGVVHAGGSVLYTITVRNPTKVTALGVIVCDRLPAGMVFVSAHIATHLHDGSRCWSIASLAAGKRKPFSVTARSLSGAQGTLVNVASLSGPSIDPRQARAPVRVLARRAPAGGVTG